MSGRKQHFIPQSLLKGYGQSGKGAKVQVVAYTHERGIFSAATDGVAAEREFYSKLAIEGEGETLDDKITAYETSFAQTLTELRSIDDGGTAEPGKAAEFVTHLVVRNDHLRKLMSSAATNMFNGFSDAFANQDQAKAMLGLSGQKPSAMFAEKLDEAYAENSAMIAMLGMSKQEFNEWAFAQGKATFGAFHAQLMGPLQQAFAEMMGKIADTAADAHRRSLEGTLSPEARIEKLKELEWRVVHGTEPLILPDCVAVAMGAKVEAFPLLLEEANDEADSVYVPLSSEQLLVGSKRSIETPNNLNDMFAECSWDFFIARDRTPQLENLAQRIRIGANKRVQDTVSDVISNAIGRFGTEGG